MPDKAYLSNILQTWTPEAQDRLMAKIPGWPSGISVYRDIVKPADRKARSVAALTQREWLFRPTSRKSQHTIYVPALGNFAWDLRDLGRCLAAAAERNATICALNTGRRIKPDAGARDFAQAQEDFQQDKRASARIGDRPGYEVSAEIRLADTRRRIELIRADWADPTIPTDVLLARAGKAPGRAMSYVTARGHLGVRRHVFRHRAGLNKARVLQERTP